MVLLLWLFQLQYGADGSAKDADGKMPYEVIPDSNNTCAHTHQGWGQIHEYL